MVKNQRLQRMMNKARYTKKGQLMLNILKYDVIWVAQHWGYLGKENACEYLKFVVELMSEDGDKKSKSSKKSLPADKVTTNAKGDTEDGAGFERKELL